MGNDLFSYSLPPFGKTIENKELLSSMAGVSLYLKKTLTLLTWDDNHIAIPLTISVDLPTLGTHEGIDIRSREDIMIVINHDKYPQIAPVVLTDRLDFPKNKLAHLYVAKTGRPPAFCVVRGSLKEWYANKRLLDLVIRTQNWLRDAACGELIENNDQFDPLRLEGYQGTAVYDYDSLAQMVLGNKVFSPDERFGVGLFEGSVAEDTGLTFMLRTIVTPDNFIEVRDRFDAETTTARLRYGFILWSSSEETFDDYSVDLPYDLDTFRRFCTKYKIEQHGFEQTLAWHELNDKVFFPVIVGIKRPKPLIGFDECVEFINFCFRVDTVDSVNGRLINNVPVRIQAHNQPLTFKKARQISGDVEITDKPFVIIGCGALGSKIVMHLARAGIANCLLIDQDKFAPHNAVRHALFSNTVGDNKAKSLVKYINEMYSIEKSNLAISLPIDGELLLIPDILKQFFWLFDFTASPSFGNALVNMGTVEQVRVAKGYLSDSGNLGVFIIEGKNRSVRIDDAQQFMYYEAVRDEYIAGWLAREQEGSENKIVSIGIGCNSETFILSDDVISMHAATFSRIIKKESAEHHSGNGKVYLSVIGEDSISHTVRKILIPEFESLTCRNDSHWVTRIRTGLLDEMRSLMNEALPNETGGVFIGSANFKTHTIHVVDFIKAPLDSKSNEVCFYRGVQGLPEEIYKINFASAGQVGYIGEWHTHPEGPEGMSAIDAASVLVFKKDFIKLPTPIPVFLMIITVTDVHVFIY